ncbi:glycosyltransferase [Peribacillus cavernae]|uniref:Glycosyltransferase n=1 Tax=Peribacillus cavernae TaxID=1674310 RepID=A0A3S0U3B5_9BACI|nr:glycosyltransferase family 2 protein [Peribacillus cavernae]MDQ0218890.1 GT2 family glycosyltransferase [Peribacillus cavernae]RUQ29388.1 glycosyltransferase [Peribacillus cavernae]
MAEDYELWLKYNALTNKQREQILTNISSFKIQPLFSIVTVVQNEKMPITERCIESVMKQLYSLFEWIIVIPSNSSKIEKAIKEYSSDARLKILTVRERNIAQAKNAALQTAAGDYIAILDAGDELSEDALFENAMMINRHPEADIIYSDEDQITGRDDRHSPFFKPDWSPDTFLAQRYSFNLGVYRTALVHKLNGFRSAYKGIEETDLVLRLSESTSDIFHIPKILYQKRDSSYPKKRKQRDITSLSLQAVEEALERRNETGMVTKSQESSTHFLVRYQAKSNPLISIIIPTRDKADLLDTCLQSIFEKTAYSNFEIIVADNGSAEPETFALFEKWKAAERDRIKIEKMDIPYNWSTINNQAVKHANGELLLFLNNDIELLSPYWLHEMAGQAMRPQIGAVGAKLVYPDSTIQHAGVILGIHGVSDHCYKGEDHDFPGYFGRLLGVANFAAVTGACLMVRKSLFEQVGGMDEKLAIEFNDVDFCLKLLEKGHFNVLLPQVILVHHESKSRGQSSDSDKRLVSQTEAAILKTRWQQQIDNDPFYNHNLELSSGNFEMEYKLKYLIELSSLAEKVADFDERITGRINAKQNGNKLELFGWAINRSKDVSSMEIFVANHEQSVVAHTKINRERKDIAAKFNDDSFLQSGWWTICDTSLLPKGTHILYAYAYLPDEKTAIKLNGEFPITV